MKMEAPSDGLLITGENIQLGMKDRLICYIFVLLKYNFIREIFSMVFVN